MSDEPKLLSCPFCGGKAQIIHFRKSWRIECQSCSAQMGRMGFSYSAIRGNMHFENEEDCIKAWNRRTENLARIGDDTVGDLQKCSIIVLDG